VLDVQTPEAVVNDTYMPLAYGDLLDLVETTVEGSLGFPLMQEQFGLNQDGDQLFFALTYNDGKHQGNGFTIAGRSSHNKTLSAAVVGGTRVFVCDNLALSGSSFHTQRKHTLNMKSDLSLMVLEGINSAAKAHNYINEHWEKMRGVALDLDLGYEIHGKALGHDVVKPQQITRAMKAWRNEFADEPKTEYPQHGRNLYGLYQSFTEGLKRGAANTQIKRHCDVNDFMLTVAHDLYTAPRVFDMRQEVLPIAAGLEID
jgi:hypothetical protein